MTAPTTALGAAFVAGLVIQAAGVGLVAHLFGGDGLRAALAWFAVAALLHLVVATFRGSF